MYMYKGIDICTCTCMALTREARHVTADTVGVATPVFDQLQPLFGTVHADMVQVCTNKSHSNVQRSLKPYSYQNKH